MHVHVLCMYLTCRCACICICILLLLLYSPQTYRINKEAAKLAKKACDEVYGSSGTYIHVHVKIYIYTSTGSQKEFVHTQTTAMMLL